MSIETSGSSASVLLQMEGKLLIGWVGDSRIMVADYARNKEKLLFESRRGFTDLQARAELRVPV